MERPPTDPLVGRLVDGRYLVGARIARGGMATVYEATDLRLDRAVALKVMPHALADDESFSLRFVREARVAARLTHPNVVAVYDQGDDDGMLFLAMEYVPGRHTLRDVIRDEAPIPPGRAFGYVEEILRALAAAHDAGIVHRDIKPENVLIDPNGKLKVADFGLARAISAATAATATGGVLMGTVSYLPPELVTDGSADARSDVYALGVLTFELLTGTKPHTGDTPIQVAYKHVHDDVPAPSSVVGGIPTYVDAFVARATSRERDLRPADARVMLQQLRRVRLALDSGVVDDQELTNDLTPTIPVAVAAASAAAAATAAASLSVSSSAGATAAAAPRTGSIWEPPTAPPDEVFDVAAYDDFPGMPAAAAGIGSEERTLVVGTPTATPPADAPTGPVRPAPPGTGLQPTPTPGSPPPYRRSRRRGWVALLIVLVLAAGAAVAGWWYGVGRFQPTPDVVDLSQAQAEKRIEAAGLTFKVGDVTYSETVDAGDVISTDPSPGDDVVQNGTVAVVVSRGPERHDVPDLSDLSESEAIDAITDHSLAVGDTVRHWDESIPEGQVIDFSPKAGTPLPPEGKVSLVISRGPKPIHLTDYTGQSSETAASTFDALGLHVVTKARYNDDVEEGLVIRQTPTKGIRYAGDTVTLYVSRGPHLVEVPRVVTFGVGAAQSALEAAGFTVRIEHATIYYSLGFVVSQSPGGGDMAPYGSEVTITVT